MKKAIKINIKPLSVNACWKGRRFKTDKYKKFERDVLFMLPKLELPKAPFQIEFEFGFSSKLSDYDNSVKPVTDILQKKYNFNDRYIKRAIIDVRLTKKGEEYFKFKITTLKINEKQFVYIKYYMYFCCRIKNLKN